MEKEKRLGNKDTTGLMITNLLLCRAGKTKLLLCNKLWWHQQVLDNDPVKDSTEQSCLTDNYHTNPLLRQIPWI